MKTITGVPESFTRAQYRSLFDAIGVDKNRVRKLEYCSDGVYVEVFEPGPDGSTRRLDTSEHHCSECGRIEDGAVVNKVFIPVIDDE